MPLVADRGAAADADEQPAPGRRRGAARARRLRRHRTRGAHVGRLRRDRGHPAQARRRRDAAGPVGQARRRVPHARRRAARADSELEPRAALGDVAALQRARPARARDVRPDDRGLVDLHRHARHRAGHLRDLRRSRAPALRGRAQGALGADRGSRRHGRRAAARGRHGGRVLPRRRVRRGARRRAAAHALRRREDAGPRRRARDDRALERRRGGEVGRADRQRGRRVPGARAPRRPPRPSSPTRRARTTRCTATCRGAGASPSGAGCRRATRRRSSAPRARA